MKILVTGGAGYIGSHTVVSLVEAGFQPVVIDNFSNSDPSAIDNMKRLLGQPVTCYTADCADRAAVSKILRTESIAGVIHFAALKYVGESVSEPLRYYQNNVAHFVSLLQTLQEHKVKCVVFSSSAAVYGNPAESIVTETSACNPESPYGWSKYTDEIILRDTCAATPNLKGVALRYFNVVGSHESALIGESPRMTPQNLLPIIVRATAGHMPPLTVFGDDYPTPDGTCLRDYVHVMDLAWAHTAALKRALLPDSESFSCYNIGTGMPTSVKKLITTFERINGVEVPHSFGPRRPGDPAAYYADVTKALTELKWKAKKSIEDAVRDAWRWHSINSTS